MAHRETHRDRQGAGGCLRRPGEPDPIGSQGLPHRSSVCECPGGPGRQQLRLGDHPVQLHGECGVQAPPGFGPDERLYPLCSDTERGTAVPATSEITHAGRSQTRAIISRLLGFEKRQCGTAVPISVNPSCWLGTADAMPESPELAKAARCPLLERNPAGWIRCCTRRFLPRRPARRRRGCTCPRRAPGSLDYRASAAEPVPGRLSGMQLGQGDRPPRGGPPHRGPDARDAAERRRAGRGPARDQGLPRARSTPSSRSSSSAAAGPPPRTARRRWPPAAARPPTSRFRSPSTRGPPAPWQAQRPRGPRVRPRYPNVDAVSCFTSYVRRRAGPDRLHAFFGRALLKRRARPRARPSRVCWCTARAVTSEPGALISRLAAHQQLRQRRTSTNSR